jgi:TPR repeat protein
MKKLLILLLLSLGFTNSSYAFSPEMDEIIDYLYKCEESLLPGCKYYQKPFTEKRIKKAMEIWLPLAEKGNAEAQWRLGVDYWDESSYSKGEDAEVIKIPEIGRKALYWITKAAEQGYEWAQIDLGMIYGNTDYHGVPVLKDPKKEIYWYKLAANQGNAYAAHLLASIYHIKAISDTYDCIHRSYCKSTTAVKNAKYWIQKTNQLGISIYPSIYWNEGEYWKFE